jgi:hypothetical protein
LFLDRRGGRRDVFTHILDFVLDRFKRANDIARDFVQAVDLAGDLICAIQSATLFQMVQITFFMLFGR